MANYTATKSNLGLEDLFLGTGTQSVPTSTGGTRTVTSVNASGIPLKTGVGSSGAAFSTIATDIDAALAWLKGVASGTRDGLMSAADKTKLDGIMAGAAVASVGATGPVASSGGTNPVISMPAASGTVNGYLASADWTTFNSKQAALGYTPINKAGDSGIGTLSMGALTATTGMFSSGPLAGETQLLNLNVGVNAAAGTATTAASIRLGWNDGGGSFANATKILAGKEGDYTIAANASSFLALYTTSANTLAERVRITSAGNVGIGTTNPNSLLQISDRSHLLQQTNSLDLSRNAYASGTNWLRDVADNKAQLIELDANGGIGLYTQSDALATAGSAVSWAPRFYITNGGNIGIGKTNPSVALDVVGAGAFTGNVSAADIHVANLKALYLDGGVNNTRISASGEDLELRPSTYLKIFDLVSGTSKATFHARNGDLTLNGTLTAASLATTQTPTASATARSHSVPIVLNGVTYYLMLSATA